MAIRQLEQSTEAVVFRFGTVANSIRMMEHEHEHDNADLSRIRKITHGFAVSEDACNTFRSMLDGLRQLEFDLHQPIRKDNSVLFPRAIE